METEDGGIVREEDEKEVGEGRIDMLALQASHSPHANWQPNPQNSLPVPQYPTSEQQKLGGQITPIELPHGERFPTATEAEGFGVAHEVPETCEAVCRTGQPLQSPNRG
jgi:hypothetical protein